MNENLQTRLVSYEPLWKIWSIEQAIILDDIPNVYRISKSGSNERALIKVFTINCRSISNREYSPNGIKQRLINLCNSLISGRLNSYKNIVTYQEYLIKEVYVDGVVVAYDIIFRMKDYNCLSLEIKNGTKFSQDEVYNLLYDISSVLCTTYDMGITHNYITPQSIFIDNDGVYNLGDFGMFNLMENLNRTLYTAPELGNDNIIHSGQSDIYSLGVIAYQLLSNNDLSKINVVNNLYPLRGVDNRLMNIVLKACEKDISKRYSSFRQLFEDLRRLENISFNQENFSNNVGVGSVSLSKSLDLSNRGIGNSTQIFIPSQQNDSKTVTVEEVVPSEGKSHILPLIIFCVIAVLVLIFFGIKIYENINDDNSDIIIANNSINDGYDEKTEEEFEITTEEISEEETTLESETEVETETEEITTTTLETIETTIETTETTQEITTVTSQTEEQVKTVTVPTVSKKYQVYKCDLDWDESNYDATTKGYHLATFTNEEEWNAMLDAAEQSGLTYLWIGGCSYVDSDGVVHLSWVNGDDSYDLNYASYVKWFVNKKGASEPSGWDINADGDVIYEPNILLWHVTTNGQGWTLCDNSSELLKYYGGKNKIGYIYMD